MSKTKERKKHFYNDCSGFDWRESDAARAKYLVKRVRDVTCGQCKCTILNTLRDLDWSTLDDSELLVRALSNYAESQKRRDE